MKRREPKRANMNGHPAHPSSFKASTKQENHHSEPPESSSKASNHIQEGSVASELPETEDKLFNLLSYPILDKAEGVKIIGSEKKFDEILQLMLDTLQDEMNELKKAHEAQNWWKINQIVHSIEGGALYLGAVRIKMACQYLQYGWRIGRRTLLERLYQQLQQTLQEGIDVFRDFQRRLP